MLARHSDFSPIKIISVPLMTPLPYYIHTQWRSAVERSGAIAPGRQGLRGAAAAGYKIFFQFNMAAREVACLAIAF